MDLTIHNALHDRTLTPVNVGIKSGKIRLVSESGIQPGKQAIDAKGAMISPALIEPHFHLENSVLPEFINHSGTLGEAIKVYKKVKDKLEPDDIMRRSAISLKEALINGTLWLRTHTDVDETTQLDLLKPILDVREQFRNFIDIEVVAFPQFGLADNPESVDLIWQAMDAGADHVGGVPHREKDMDKAARQIELAFEIAVAHDAGIDMHVDETDDPYWHTLELLAEKTIDEGYQKRVTAGHCCAMSAWSEKLFQRILPKIVEADITICTNTPVNLLIQGRGDNHPVRRGIARIKDLLEAGVNVTCGQDDMQNMFYPFGSMDGFAIANYVAHTAHLSSPTEIQAAFDMPRYNAARMLGLRNYGIEEGSDANIIIFQANSAVDALRKHSDRMYVIRQGEILVESERRIRMSPELPFDA